MNSDLKKRLLDFMRRTGTGKPVIFIHMSSGLDKITPVITDIINEGFKPRLICANSDMPIYFERLRSDYGDIKISEDYLDVETLEGIDKFAHALASEWHLFDNADFKKIIGYHGINLGRIVEYDLQLYLLKAVKMLETMDSIARKDAPSAIFIISDSPEDFFGLEKLIKDLHKIEFKIFPIKIDKPLPAFALKENLKGAIADFLTNVVDFSARMILNSRKFRDKVLIDRRVHEDLSKNISLPEIFISAPFEKGLRLRIDLIKRRGAYFPFYFPPNVSFGAHGAGYDRFRKVEAELFTKELFKYKNSYIGDIVRPKIREYFESTFPRIVKNIVLFEDFFKRNSLKGVVLRHDLWEIQRLSVELGRICKIPSLVIQHGVFGEKIERVIFADKIAVWGKMCKEIYKAFGNDESKCVVTGNPRHDILHNNPEPKLSRAKICEQLKLDPGKSIVVLLSAHDYLFNSAYMTEDRFEVIVKHVLRAMAELSDKQLVIKLHPYEEGFFAREAIKYFGIKNAVVVKGIDLYSLLNAADLVMSKESSAGLKALILDKPFITLNFEKRADVIPYALSGAALGVYRAEDTLPAIKKVFSDNELRSRLHEKSKDFIRDYAYMIDGKSSERVLDFIRDTTDRGN